MQYCNLGGRGFLDAVGFTSKGGAGVVCSPVRVISFGVCLGHPLAGGRLVTEGLLALPVCLPDRLKGLRVDLTPARESRDFRLMVLAGTIFTLGQAISYVAIPWQIYTLTGSQSADGYQRVVRIEQAMQAHDGNFVDKITDDCYKDMAYSLTRIADRTSGKG